MKFSIALPIALLAASASAAALEPRVTQAPAHARRDDAAASQGASIGENVGNAIKTAETAAASIAGNVGDKAKDIGTDVASAAVSGWNAAATGAADAADKAKDAVGGAIDGAKKALGDNAASPRAVLPTVFAGAAGLAVGVAALLF